MHKKGLASSGFTLVELLIVIVIIAILASITIVAYSGITDRANDVAVQNDLSNYAKKVELYHVTNGEYPDSATILDNLGLKASQGSYDTASGNNLFYCRKHPGTTDSYAFMAQSKSGTVFYASSNGSGVSTENPSAASTCDIVDLTYQTDGAVATGYVHSSNTWSNWTE